MKPASLFLCVLINFACSKSSTQSPADAAAPPADLSRPMLGMPIAAPMATWTWIDFPEATCDDGTATGIGVNVSDPDKLLVFLNGGGACWSYTTCVALGTASAGPGKPQFDQIVNSAGGDIFDRTLATNPFKDWSFVFVPYCTGDLHGGDNVITYTQGNDSRVYRHKGHANMEAFMPRIAATWPQTTKTVLSGSSAGGYGTLLNYDLFRHYFPTGEAYLLDDSGPVLTAEDFPLGFLAEFYASWNLAANVGGICPTCQQDISAIVPALGDLYPHDRFTLMSSLQDKTISGYLILSPSGFQTGLYDLASQVLDAQPNFRYFYIPGNTHTMLGEISTTTSNGVGVPGGTSLIDWLTAVVGDDPSWHSIKP